VKVKEKLSPVLRIFDLNTRAAEATVCGMVSSLRQATVVPTLTVRFCGAKVNLSSFTIAVSAWTASEWKRVAAAKAAATRRAALGEHRRRSGSSFCIFWMMSPVTVFLAGHLIGPELVQIYSLTKFSAKNSGVAVLFA